MISISFCLFILLIFFPFLFNNKSIFILFFYFTILYWFCHTLAWIHHGCTRVLHPEPPSHHPPSTIPLGHPSAPAPSILYHASNLDWWFISYMILYMFKCHSPKSSLPSLSHRVQKTVLCIHVSFAVSHSSSYFLLCQLRWGQRVDCTQDLGWELLRMRVEAFPGIQVPLHITLGKAKKSRIKDMRTLSKALFPLIMRTWGGIGYELYFLAHTSDRMCYQSCLMIAMHVCMLSHVRLFAIP